jgi:hypothetical protein
LIIDALQALLYRDAMPVIPSQGSVGASGDLAPLAHLIAALMGHGRIDVAGEVMPAEAALQKLCMEPLQLGPKEGLALINGNQASAAIALDALFMGERVFAAALAAWALSVEAIKGSAKPFDPRISELRGQPGQIRVDAAIKAMLDGSEILAAQEDGYHALKFFPAVPAGGSAMLKAWQGPFGDVKFCPTGGIGAGNAPEFLALANVACVGGSWLTPGDAVAKGDWARITALATEAAKLPRP